MNTVKSKGFRGYAIAAVLAVGIATTIATGGGSGSLAPGGLPVTADPTLAITADNGEAVASSVLIGVGLSFDLGEVSGDTLVGPVDSAFSSLPARSVAPLYSKTYLQDPQAIRACEISGTVDMTITVANPDQSTVGDRIVAVFDECDDNLGYVISGTVDMTISALEGDPASGMFLVGIEMLLADVVITEGTDVVTSNGDFTMTIDSRGFPVVIMTVAGDALEIGADGEITTLTGFEHSLTVDSGPIPDSKLAEAFGRLDSLILGGSVDYETVTPIQAIGDFDPHAGVILVTGANGSLVRIILVDSANVTLEIDVNGDGVIDAYVYTSWAELNGQITPNGAAALINSSTAPTVAQEVFNGITGFGSVAVASGGQFAPSGVFGQVADLGISGTFGPLTVDCLTSGTANVSGSLAAGGTFNAGDRLEATFLSCTRGGEVLDGSLGFNVSGFEQTPGDAYRVTGTASQNQFRRFVGGSCYTGTGSLTTTHDFVYTNTGVLVAESAAGSISIMSGGVTQTLNNATVRAEVTLGQQPVEISRTSSGTITSDALGGAFQYESVTPQVFLLDDSAVTGPYAGVLVVTASDNSKMHMVALDELNLRLDLDFDGDSVIDEQISAAWVDFDYGNSFGICELPLSP